MSKRKRKTGHTARALLGPLTVESFAYGLGYLADADPDLGQIVKDLGPPPLWSRKPGFPTLLYIILEQQVSLASAKAAYDRLLSTISPLTPASFLTLDDVTLKTIGFSRQKMTYGRHLAQAISTGQLSLTTLDTLDDTTARAILMEMKGIGPWTADIYLLMALRRPDIWPSGDLALRVATQQVKRLHALPTPEVLEEMSMIWKPWRAVAARLLWHYYLHGRECTE
jgi:DNA-3-methyladenine glycosylase II